jgi:hypothetical protein
MPARLIFFNSPTAPAARNLLEWRAFMLKRMLLCLATLGLASCTSNGNRLDPEVASILKVMVIGGFLAAIIAAIAAIAIKENSERRVAAGLVALGAVTVGIFFVLVLVA